MSKIIVDQIQKNGGDVLTLPATDATANNQPLVGSTTGVLSHSPLSLPAADGAANKPVTTDGSAQLQFGAFALPSTTGTDGQVLTSTGTAAAWEDIASGTNTDLKDDTSYSHPTDKVVGTMITTTGRQHGYSSGQWDTSGPNSTYQSQNAFSSHPEETWNMLLGDGYAHTANDRPYVNNTRGDAYRELQYAHGNRVGHFYKDYYHYQNQTSYSGLTFRALPIRNKGSSDVTAVFYIRASMYNDSYSGASFGYYTPTNSSGTLYSTVTGGSWTAVWSNTGSSANTNAGAQNVTVPAGKTVIAILVSAHSYQTTYRFVDTSLFYSLDTTFTNSDIHCDIRMLHAMQTARSGRNSTVSSTNSLAYPYVLWTDCAKLYGDR